ncbi:hypothetical protein C0J52_23181 [Blattella germanica]|nr:hypothetical protein C0J52_23181 [Blattella germanica]
MYYLRRMCSARFNGSNSLCLLAANLPFIEVSNEQNRDTEEKDLIPTGSQKLGKIYLEAKKAGKQMSDILRIPSPPTRIGKLASDQLESSNSIFRMDSRQPLNKISVSLRKDGENHKGVVRMKKVNLGCVLNFCFASVFSLITSSNTSLSPGVAHLVSALCKSDLAISDAENVNLNSLIFPSNNFGTCSSVTMFTAGSNSLSRQPTGNSSLTARKLNEIGTVHNLHKGNSGRRRTARTQQNIEAVRMSVNQSPRKRIPKTCERAEIEFSVRQENLFPYKLEILPLYLFSVVRLCNARVAFLNICIWYRNGKRDSQRKLSEPNSQMKHRLMQYERNWTGCVSAHKHKTRLEGVC